MLKKGVKEKFEFIPMLILLLLIFLGFGIIKEFFLKPAITGFTTLTDTIYCDQTKSSDYYDLGGTITCDDLSYSNGAKFTGNNTELNCKDNLITASGAIGFGMNWTKVISNLTIRNCRITSFTTEGIHLDSANNTLIIRI